eukprot:TRINITY_DN32545_c0_g1_i1.p1 TRINITY_DN32545_c0_g1~~TRINITY_DN32545_c0_g1_i1.p1  ORF type:complete len:665 (+),score=84.37 TRINITY_DN32545_c0_g1_i1:57-2051(+)
MLSRSVLTSLHAFFLHTASACSNLLVPSGSSADGSTILAYNNDGSYNLGALHHWPAEQHASGELRPTYDWDSGVYLGAIPQPSETYNVVGNTNEYQLTITETTFGGLDVLDGTDGRAVCHEVYGCLDYGQLIWVTLARTKTARQAISTIDELLQTYGYASSGESFSIADTKEVWLMEIIGKGNLSKGAVWVATRIPDGSVSSHANQARTREFHAEKPDHFKYSKDVVDFARGLGLFQGDDRTFSFSDVYDPVTPYSARTCEARVFSFFLNVAAPEERIGDYVDYVEGRNLSHRMPLYVRVNVKLSVNDTMWHMRNHYEGTVLDPSFDVGAGEWRSPIRLGYDGHVWTSGGKKYMNARPISVPYTIWNLVAVQRPHHRYGVLWFGVDDSAFTVRAPFYGVASRVPRSWDDGNCTQRDACREELGLPGTLRKFSFQSMFWVCNMISNYAYSRYDQIAPAVYERIAEIEGKLQMAVEKQDQTLMQLFADGATSAEVAEVATDFSFRTAERLHEEWLDFYGELFATFVDGYRLEPLARSSTTPTPEEIDYGFVKRVFGFRDLWKREIAATTGRRYEVPDAPGISTSLGAVATKDKRCLRAFGASPGRCLSFEGGSPRSAASDGSNHFRNEALVIALACAGFVSAAFVGLRWRCRHVAASKLDAYALLS